MRYFFVIFLLGAIVSQNLSAQKKKGFYRHEISYSMSPLSMPFGDSRYRDKVENELNLGREHYLFDGIFFAPSNGLRYFYHHNRRFAYGGYIGLTQETTYERWSWVENYTKFEPYRIATETDIKHASFILMPMAKWNWVNRRYFTLYSKGGIGVCFQKMWMESDYYAESVTDKYKSSTVQLALQLTPLGMSFGYRNLHCFFELGLGMEGLLAIGICYRFKRIEI